MHTDTMMFLMSLFEKTAGCITLTAAYRQSGCRSPTPSRHIPASHSTSLYDAADKLSQTNQLGWEAYVGIALRRPGLGRWQRGGLNEVVALPALFVDMDEDPTTCLLRLQDFPLKPSCLVSSARGVHSYFFLDEPTPDLILASQVLRGLSHHLKGDKTSTAHSLRLPGTLNWKYDPPRLCHLLELHPERRYQLEDFRQYRFIPAESAVPPPLYLPGAFSRAIVQEIVDILFRQFGAYYRPVQTWIPALCPAGHQRDSPGQHFGFNPEAQVGFCFGRHGKLPMPALCDMLQLSIPDIIERVKREKR